MFYLSVYTLQKKKHEETGSDLPLETAKNKNHLLNSLPNMFGVLLAHISAIMVSSLKLKR